MSINISVERKFQKLKKRTRLILITALLFFVGAVQLLSAQNTSEEVEFTVLRDRDSLTFIFTGNVEVPFHDIRIDVFLRNGDVDEIYLQEYFDMLDRYPLQVPVCLRIQWEYFNRNLPLACDEPLITGEQRDIFSITEFDIFWMNRQTGRYFSLEFYQGESRIGVCRDDQVGAEGCKVTFVPLPLPTFATPTPTATLEPAPFATATAQYSSFDGTNSSWHSIVMPDFGFGHHDMVIVPSPPSGMIHIGSSDLPNSPEQDIGLETSYMIDRYEVSRGQYASCLSQGGCSEYPNSTIDPNVNADSTLPRTGISPTGANEYCRWALGADGRLPTEYAWEYAAAGPEGWDYPWGDDPSDAQSRAVFAGNFGGNPVSVEQPGNDQSWVGARHMSGNVREIAGEEGVYVARGGDYNASLVFIRTQFRPLPEYLDLDLDVTGFRCMVPLND